jgi:hypothetical protein
MAAPKDRWHQLADAIRDSNLTPADKHVFSYLLSTADFKTAEMSPQWTPTRQKIRRKTSLSYSQIGYSTRHLERHGWLAATGRTGPGRPLRYSLALGADCDCTGRVHARQRCQPQVATVPTDDPRTLPTNGANAAGQTPDAQRGSEGEGKRELLNWPDSWPEGTIGQEMNQGRSCHQAQDISR